MTQQLIAQVSTNVHQPQPFVYPCLSTSHKLPHLLALTCQATKALTCQATKAIEAGAAECKYLTVFTPPTQPRHASRQPLFGLVQLPFCIGVHLA